MADRPPKRPDPLDDPIDILDPAGRADDLEWARDEEVDIADDPLDDDDPLLSQSGAPLPPAQPEPDASPLPEPPARPAPDASWPDGPEPEGDDLSWAEPAADEPVSDDALPQEVERSNGAGDSAASEDGIEDAIEDWVADEPLADESLWAGLEDERLVTVGAEERASLPALQRPDLRARISTLHARSVLRTADEALVALGEVTTPVHIGGVAVTVTLAIAAASVEELIVARDVLSGRFLVDPGRSGLLAD